MFTFENEEISCLSRISRGNFGPTMVVTYTLVSSMEASLSSSPNLLIILSS